VLRRTTLVLLVARPRAAARLAAEGRVRRRLRLRQTFDRNPISASGRLHASPDARSRRCAGQLQRLDAGRRGATAEPPSVCGRPRCESRWCQGPAARGVAARPESGWMASLRPRSTSRQPARARRDGRASRTEAVLVAEMSAGRAPASPVRVGTVAGRDLYPRPVATRSTSAKR
jgi:hypothetical protein